ncbi:MAG: sucrase ferredoxin [Nocardioides sp.]
MSFRCADASVGRTETIAGTASTVRAFLLLEHVGPWGVDALRDARLPDGLGQRLHAAAAAARVRVLLVRRPDRSETDGTRVFAAHADPVRPWLEAGALGDVQEVLDLDLAGLGAGRTAGLARQPGPIFCVCTHGRHDVCCATRGRPVAAALEAAHPDATWEVSHIGGDRFAANMVVLPHGLYYGRLDPVSALTVAGAQRAGQLDLDHLRGRSGLAMPVQAAEVALRRQLAETRDGALLFASATRTDDVTEAVFEVGGTSYAVRVRSRAGIPERLTCRAERDHAPPVHEVLSIGLLRRSDDGGPQPS